MSDSLDEAADLARSRFGIPPVGAPENHSTTRDGWLVPGHEPPYIGLIRNYDIDHRPGRRSPQPRLLARELMEHMLEPRVGTHVSRSFTQMLAAGHHVHDPALVLAIASRELTPRAAITLDTTYRCSYDFGGLDSAWGLRRVLPIPPAVRRRLRPASDGRVWLRYPGEPETITHLNERGRPIRPADVRGYDQVILYAAYVLRAERQLRAQLRRVFGGHIIDDQQRIAGWTVHVRRAWTQLSFGRGGGTGLVQALERVRDQDASLETIFTDRVMVQSNSVKRARVTAGDAFLIDRFVIRGTTLALRRRASELDWNSP